MKTTLVVTALLGLILPAAPVAPVHAEGTPAADRPAPTPTDRPFLWMVDTTPPAFLYGTIHLPDRRVLAEPEVVTAAFGAAGALYTEIPMDRESMSGATVAFMLPEGQTLGGLLPEALFTRADAYLKERGLGLKMMNQMTPIAVSVQLATLDYLEELQTTMPLDMMLYSRAGEAGKKRSGIETIEEQTAMFTALTMEEQITLLDTTLAYLESAEGKDMTEKMVLSYLNGDGAELMDVMTSYMDSADPVHRKFEALLFNERNDRMSDRIDAVLRDTDEVTFIAVGAAHFFGDDGILTQLRAKGHEIHRLSAADTERVEEAVMAVN